MNPSCDSVVAIGYPVVVRCLAIVGPLELLDPAPSEKFLPLSGKEPFGIARQHRPSSIEMTRWALVSRQARRLPELVDRLNDWSGRCEWAGVVSIELNCMVVVEKRSSFRPGKDEQTQSRIVDVTQIRVVFRRGRLTFRSINPRFIMLQDEEGATDTAKDVENNKIRICG